MVVRKGRKKNKQRGSRTKHGNTKNARGSGCRGGKGMAGGHKHRFSICYKNFGVKIRMKTKKTSLISLKLLEFEKMLPKLLEKKLAEKKGSEIVVDGERAGIEKIFGSGEIKQAVLLKNIRASESAKDAIVKAGGKIEEVAEAEKKPEKKSENITSEAKVQKQ